MAILGLQGVRGGTGTTSITAALAWALQLLGETVLVVDASPDNMLRFFFNVDFSHKAGWARATIDGSDWRDAGHYDICFDSDHMGEEKIIRFIMGYMNVCFED